MAKQMKKIMAVALAIALCMAQMVIPAFAAGTDVHIKVDNIEVVGGNKDDITGIKKTMKVGIETGIVNGYHVHYFNDGPFWCYRTAMSSDPYFRSCYDEMYRYMHNVLTVEELWIDPIEKEQSIPDGAVDWI